MHFEVQQTQEGKENMIHSHTKVHYEEFSEKKRIEIRILSASQPKHIKVPESENGKHLSSTRCPSVLL